MVPLIVVAVMEAILYKISVFTVCNRLRNSCCKRYKK